MAFIASAQRRRCENSRAHFRGKGRVQPGVPAFAGQPGLVEVHHRRGTDAGGDLGQEFGEITGGAGGHGRYGAIGHRDAEQLPDGLRGAFLGQELTQEQLHDDRAQHRPDLRRRRRVIRGGRGGAGPAAATAGDHLAFGDWRVLPWWPAARRVSASISPATTANQGSNVVSMRTEPAEPRWVECARFRGFGIPRQWRRGVAATLDPEGCRQPTGRPGSGPLVSGSSQCRHRPPARPDVSDRGSARVRAVAHRPRGGR